MDILRLDAERFARENNFTLWPGRCDKCHWPLFQKKEQRVPFCVSCYRNEEQTQRGIDLLERIKRRPKITYRGNEIFYEEKGAA